MEDKIVQCHVDEDPVIQMVVRTTLQVVYLHHLFAPRSWGGPKWDPAGFRRGAVRDQNIIEIGSLLGCGMYSEALSNLLRTCTDFPLYPFPFTVLGSRACNNMNNSLLKKNYDKN